MRRIATTLTLFIASTLTGAATVADPLHKYGDDGAWCHVESGWMFPKEVGDFVRVLQPYNIDGNNDAGAEYRQESAALSGKVEVEVYAADSAAKDANMDGARATAAHKAGADAKVDSEQPFEIAGMNGLNSVKIKYATNAGAAAGQTTLYYVSTDRWRVKVLAQAGSTSSSSDRALDAFVQSLPWNSLGTNPGIH